jgi:hypothetical protein
MSDAEALTLRNFVVSPKRERLLTLHAAGPRRRRDLCAQLPHLRALDPRWVKRLPGDQQTPTEIASHLRSLGASATCQALSENPDIDGRTLALGQALEDTVGRGYSTLLIISPGELAYFEDEEPGERYVLHRRSPG